MSGYISGGIDLLTKKVDNQGKNNHWTLVYIREGIGLYLLGSSLRTLNKGDMMILPSNVYYSFVADDLGDEYNENIKAHVVRFDEDWMDDLLKVFPVMSDTVLKIKEIRNPLAVSGPKWMQIASVLDDFSRSAISPSGILELLKQISEASDVHPIIDMIPTQEPDVPHKIEMINRYLSCNICGKVTLEDVSSYVGMSRTYFCMFFKNHFKENFSDYLNRKRIERACHLLARSSKDIPAISSECGFKTVPYFTRVFTKVAGTTPGRYRKNMK